MTKLNIQTKKTKSLSEKNDYFKFRAVQIRTWFGDQNLSTTTRTWCNIGPITATG